MLYKVDFAILPVLNVDGYVYTWTEVRTLLHFLRSHLLAWSSENCALGRPILTVDLLTNNFQNYRPNKPWRKYVCPLGHLRSLSS